MRSSETIQRQGSLPPGDTAAAHGPTLPVSSRAHLGREPTSRSTSHSRKQHPYLTDAVAGRENRTEHKDLSWQLTSLLPCACSPASLACACVQYWEDIPTFGMVAIGNTGPRESDQKLVRQAYNRTNKGNTAQQQVAKALVRHEAATAIVAIAHRRPLASDAAPSTGRESA